MDNASKQRSAEAPQSIAKVSKKKVLDAPVHQSQIAAVDATWRRSGLRQSSHASDAEKQNIFTWANALAIARWGFPSMAYIATMAVNAENHIHALPKR
jgi:UV DNA damage repair endonuclease